MHAPLVKAEPAKISFSRESHALVAKMLPKVPWADSFAVSGFTDPRFESYLIHSIRQGSADQSRNIRRPRIGLEVSRGKLFSSIPPPTGRKSAKSNAGGSPFQNFRSFQ